MEIDTFERIDTLGIDTNGTWITANTVGGDGSGGFISVPGLAGGLWGAIDTTYYRAIPWTFGTVLRRSVPVIGKVMVLRDDGGPFFEGLALADVSEAEQGEVGTYSRLDWEPED